VLFDGGFDTGTLGGWGVIRAAPDRLTTVTSPVRQGAYAAKFSVDDSDIAPATATGDPRAQLNSDPMSREGDDQWFGWSTFFPADFPAVPTSGFFCFFQWHGQPWSGSPRLAFYVAGGNVLFIRDDVYNYDRPWSGPLVRNAWQDFVVHVKWSKDANVGFIELWFNGAQQTFSNGQQRLAMATIQSDQSAVETIPTSYRKKGMIGGTVTLYQDAVKVGTSYAAVAP
jgi:hypothetical protein